MGYKEEYRRWLNKGIMVDELKALSDSEIEECGQSWDLVRIN